MNDMNILKPFLGASLIVSVMALTACDQPKRMKLDQQTRLNNKLQIQKKQKFYLI